MRFFGGDRRLNPGPCLHYALSIRTELSSRGQYCMRLLELKKIQNLKTVSNKKLLRVVFLPKKKKLRVASQEIVFFKRERKYVLKG